MNVVIIGAGTVGQTIAELLCTRGINVCVIDHDPEVLQRVEERLDVSTVLGSANDVSRLFQAGVQVADLCLAVTSSDEVNLTSASIAGKMGTRRTVARVFNPIFRNNSTFDYQRHFGIDRLISLEFLTAIELARHVRSSSILAAETFARGGVQVHELKVGRKAKAVGVPLQQLKLPSSVRIGLIANEAGSIIPGADASISLGDRITLIGAHGELEKVASQFEDRSSHRTRVVIAGGGEIGFNLARLLERTRCRVTVLESDADRCELLAERLPRSTVLHANVKSRADLEEARIGKTDVFVACTGRDEENIVCGVEAKELGCKRLITIVRSPDYANVLGRLGVDTAVSPREAMSRQISGLVASGPIQERTSIADDAAEVWELEVPEGCPATMCSLRDLALSQSLVAAIERDDHVKLPSADDQLRPGDLVIMLVQKDAAERVGALFRKEK